MRRAVVDIPRDPGTDLRAAICTHLVGESRGGATIAALAPLGLNGSPLSSEVEHVSENVSRLIQEGEVILDGELVVPVSGPVAQRHAEAGHPVISRRQQIVSSLRFQFSPPDFGDPRAFTTAGLAPFEDPE
ncbi:MAG TPA: hypothetical protein VFS35_01045 [Terrimicrobiaceae bacterium]|nr:hypothetical protein [Terrimicrobiaceae bacterium]